MVRLILADFFSTARLGSLGIDEAGQAERFPATVEVVLDDQRWQGLQQTGAKPARQPRLPDAIDGVLDDGVIGGQLCGHGALDEVAGDAYVGRAQTMEGDRPECDLGPARQDHGASQRLELDQRVGGNARCRELHEKGRQERRQVNIILEHEGPAGGASGDALPDLDVAQRVADLAREPGDVAVVGCGVGAKLLGGKLTPVDAGHALERQAERAQRRGHVSEAVGRSIEIDDEDLHGVAPR
jgi:hypothetical protein